MAKRANKSCGGLLNTEGKIKQARAYFRYNVADRNAQQIEHGFRGGSSNGVPGQSVTIIQ